MTEYKCDNCGKDILGKRIRLPLSTICPECRDELANILVRFEHRTTEMTDRDYQVIGHSFSKLLLDEDIERIIALLRRAEITSGGGVASRTYLATRLRFETVATLLKTSRRRYNDSNDSPDN
jgi:DNA-directed RNA polymerase subunit RPC12/RpoP